MQNNKRNTRGTRNNSDDMSAMIYGKIPPSAIELEKAILGHILTEQNAYNKISDILKSETFYKESHATIFRCIQDLFRKSEPIDLLTVTEELRNNKELENIGGAYYLSELTDFMYSDIVHYARIVVQKFIQREMIRICNDIITESFEDITDVFELHQQSLLKLEHITSHLNNSEVYSLKNGVIQILQKIADVRSGALKATIYKTFLSYLNFYPSSVAVVAAKPGTGKTTFMLNCAKEQALEGINTGIVTIEMDLLQLSARLIQEDTGIGGARMLTYNIDEYGENRIKENRFTDLPIYIIPVEEIKYKELFNTIGVLVRKYKCKVVYIDYLQLIGTDDYKEQDLKKNENIMRQCVKAAKYFNIPVVLLSQMSRGDITVENLDEKLRSGGIEQGAAQILGIDYVNKGEQIKSWKDQLKDVRGFFKIINSKNRFDERFGEKIFYHDMPKQKMMEHAPFVLEEEMQEQPNPNKKNESFDIF